MKIDELNTVEYEKQEQQPNPTLIDTVTVAGGDKDADTYMTSGKTVVITSYALATGAKNWYPSIHFHDLDRNESTWQIHGAEIFVNINQELTTKVTIITNEMWSSYSQQSYDEMKAKLYSNDTFSIRHREYDSYMIKLKYGDPAEKELVMNQEDKTKLNFLNNDKLDITKNAKVLEAYSHNGDRLTLLY